LVDRLSDTAFNAGDLIDRQNREINFEARLGAVRSVEINGLHGDGFACADGLGDLHCKLLLFVRHADSIFRKLNNGTEHFKQR
jgi:hypothetical protein